jgi:hypothetical protein
MTRTTESRLGHFKSDPSDCESEWALMFPPINQMSASAWFCEVGPPPFFEMAKD